MRKKLIGLAGFFLVLSAIFLIVHGTRASAPCSGANCGTGSLQFTVPGGFSGSGVVQVAVSAIGSDGNKYTKTLNLNITTVPLPPPTPPTASLTVAGTNHATVYSGSAASYVWSTTGSVVEPHTTTLVQVYNSTNNASPSNPVLKDGCGNPTGGDLSAVVGKLPSGSFQINPVPACEEGYTYDIRYSVSGPGGSASAELFLTVVPPGSQIAGTCGPDSGQSFASLNNSDPGLCGIGPVANFSGLGPWGWNCNGTNPPNTGVFCQAFAAAAPAISLGAAPSFVGTQGGSAPASKSMTISNPNWGSTLKWQASTNAPAWCTVSPNSGTAVFGGPATLNVTMGSPSILGIGPHTCTITVSDNGSSPSVTGGSKTANVDYTISGAACPAGSVILSNSSVVVGSSVTASPSDPGFTAGNFIPSNGDVGIAGNVVTGNIAGSLTISGTNWKYKNGATGCTLASAPLTVVPVGAPPFNTVTLSASSANDPAAPDTTTPVTLKADVGGTEVGTMNYNFWWNCSNPTTDVATAEADLTCGALPAPVAGSCQTNANGEKCDGVAAPTETAVNTYASAGSYSPKVIIERGAPSESVQQQLALTVVNAPGPTISTVSINCVPGGLPANAQSTCTATVNGTGAFNPNVNNWVLTSGTGTLVPIDGTHATYTAPNTPTNANIRAQSVGDPSVSGNATIVVTVPPTCSISANPTSVVPPGKSNLSWSSKNATNCTLTQDVGTSIGAVTPNVPGSTLVTPTAKTTFTLTCNGAGATVCSQGVSVDIGNTIIHEQ